MADEAMPPAGKPMRAPWLARKWQRCEYLAGRGYLRPVPGAKWEVYDPFSEILERRLGPKKLERWSLPDALSRLEYQDQGACASFCARWGPLGLYQHSLVRQSYVPAWGGGIGPRDVLTADMAARVIETPYAFTWFPPLHEAVDEDEQEAWLRGKTLPSTAWIHGAVLGDGLADHGLVDGENLARHCRRYFPDLPGEWPSLHSAEWWEHYCEPIEEFQKSVRQFQSTCEIYAGLEARRLPNPEFWRAVLLARLRAHLRSVRTELVHDMSDPPAPWQIRPVVPSLLAVGYWLLVRGIAQNRTIRFCLNEDCGRPFPAIHARRQYCGDRCANTQVKRNKRRRERLQSTEVEEAA